MAKENSTLQDSPGTSAHEPTQEAAQIRRRGNGNAKARAKTQATTAASRPLWAMDRQDLIERKLSQVSAITSVLLHRVGGEIGEEHRSGEATSIWLALGASLSNLRQASDLIDAPGFPNKGAEQIFQVQALLELLEAVACTDSEDRIATQGLTFSDEIVCHYLSAVQDLVSDATKAVSAH